MPYITHGIKTRKVPVKYRVNNSSVTDRTEIYVRAHFTVGESSNFECIFNVTKVNLTQHNSCYK